MKYLFAVLSLYFMGVGTYVFVSDYVPSAKTIAVTAIAACAMACAAYAKILNRRSADG